MAPPKKGQKMSLGDFLGGDSAGSTAGASWADEMEDMPPIGGASSGYGSQRRDYGGASASAGGATDRYSGYSRADDSMNSRAQLPIPDKGPWTAHVGNLSFDASENEINDFFASCEVTNVRLVRDRLEDRPKGFGYVEFGSKEGLVAALALNGEQLAGRNVRINVAEPPKDRADERFAGEWRRAGPLPTPERESAPRRGAGAGYERYGSERGGDREGGERRQSSYEQGDGKVRDFGNWERKGPLSPATPSTPTGDHGARPPRNNDREFTGSDSGRGERQGFAERPRVERQPTAADQDNQWRKSARPDAPARSTPASPVMAHVRPKLELKKRSEQSVDTAAAAAAAATDASKPNPFGAARPIDTFQREKEVAEKRAAAIAEKKAQEEKAREEKKLAAVAAREAEEKATEEAKVAEPTSEDAAAETPASEPRKVAEKPAATKGPDNWRSRGPPKDVRTEQRDTRAHREPREPKKAVEEPQDTQDTQDKESKDKPAEVEDGWATVPAKGRRGGSNGRTAPA